MKGNFLLLPLLASVCLLAIAQSVAYSEDTEDALFIFTVLALGEGFIFGYVVAKLFGARP